MFRILSILILTFLSTHSLANSNKVAVVVNDKVITEKDIFDRKNFIILVQNLHNIKEPEISYIKRVATESLIEDLLLEKESKKYNFQISEQEVQQFIASLEDMKQLGRGFFKQRLAHNQDAYQSFIKKTSSDIIKQRINGEVLFHSVSISNSEMDDISIRAGKDASLSFREIAINSNSDKAYNILRNSRALLINCGKDQKISDLTISRSEKKLSELSKAYQELFFDLKVGEYTKIIDSDGTLKMYQLCARKIENVTEKETDYLMSYLGNKKLHYKMLKYIETIRKKAYIKYL